MTVSSSRLNPMPLAGAAEGGPERFPAIAVCCLLALLMAAPLAFGAVEAWAWASFSIAVLLLSFAWAVHCWRSGRLQVVWSPLMVLPLALLALAMLQLRAGWTLDAAATREAIIKLLSAWLVFFLGLQFLSGASFRLWRGLGLAISLYAFALALFAVIQFLASPDLLYFSIRPRWGGYVFGPYVSHNNYAGLMEMLAAIAAGLVLALRRQHPAKPFAVFAVLLCMVSVLLSGSRGGVMSLLAEFAIFITVMLLAGPASQLRRRALMVGFALAVLAGASFFWLDPGGVWNRWQQLAETRELTAGDRVRMSADSWRIARDHARHGVGLGAFATAYPAYQTVITDDFIDYAHNDYLQLAAEGGVAAWILMLLGVPGFVWIAFRGLRRRLRQPAGWLQIGAAVGVCGILVHSLVDFNLHIPANAAWLAFCAALALAPGKLARQNPSAT